MEALAVPLGGYVKFVGDMNATSQPDESGVEALSEDEKRVAFHTQPIWKRAATVVAGPMFNFILAIVVFSAMFAIYGRYITDPVVAEVRDGSPAQIAGFEPGDVFVSVDGRSVETFADVQRYVSGRAGDRITFVMRRGDRDLTLVATPEFSEQKDAIGNTVRIGVIGVVNNREVGKPRLSSSARQGPWLKPSPKQVT